MGTFSFRKTYRISRRVDFERLSRDGRKIYRTHFVVAYCPNNLGNLRLGVTVSRKLGNAVMRNRVKRLVREYFRLNKAQFDDGYDMNVIARTGATGLSFHDVNQTLAGISLEMSGDYRNEAFPVGTH